MEIKEKHIKPIEGFKNLVVYGKPEVRKERFQHLGERIKRMLGIELGIKDIEERCYSDSCTINIKSSPYFSIQIRIDIGGIKNKIVIFAISGLCPSLHIKYNEYDYTINGHRYFPKYTNYNQCRPFLQCPSFLLFAGEYLNELYEYFQSIYKKAEIDMEEIIRFTVPKILEITERITPYIEKTEEALKYYGLNYFGGCYNTEYHAKEFYGTGHYLFMDDKLTVVFYKELNDLKNKLIKKESIPLLKDDGTIEDEKLYIYDAEPFIYYDKYKLTRVGKYSGKCWSDKFIIEMGVLKKFNIHYDKDLLEKFYAAINSGNKFVIFTGATGTGKTLLSLLYPAVVYSTGSTYALRDWAEKSEDENALKKKIQKELKNYVLLLPVRPNWTSPRDLIGYYNPLGQNPEGKFVKGILYDFLEKAEKEEYKKFFLILDEMNLSHPEYYLSDIISAMETKGKISINQDDEIKEIKKEIEYPENLYIIGTVNTDETTKTLSPRLKSRAFTINLRADFDKIETDDEAKRNLLEILKILNKQLSLIDLGVGYRDFKHISEFIENGGNMDDALIQKIIPRISTTNDKFPNVVDEITKGLENNPELKEFINELIKLKSKFESQGYI